MMPRTIRGLILLMGALISGLTALLGGTTYYFANKSMVDQLNARITLETRALTAIGRSDGLAGVVAAVRAREVQPSVGNLGYIVIDAHGRHLAGSLRGAVPPPGYWDDMAYIRADGAIGEAQSLNSAIPGGGRLVVAADRSIVNDADGTVLILFGTAFAFILLFGVGSALIVGRIVKARLAGIATTAEAIMAGDLSRRMPIAVHPGEFDQVSAVINRMLERIEVLLGNLRRISSGVAHDIRSPLNRARGSLEAAERSLAGRPEQEHVRQSIRDVDDVLDLLRALLGITEIEGFSVRKRFRAIDLASLVEDVVDGYRPVVEGAGLTIDARVSPVTIDGDAALLRRALANLIDNAILYTPAGTFILVTVAGEDGSAILRVADDGPGVPPGERTNIFTRFVRLDTSRSTPGHGLGLNLVAAVAGAHRGSARALPTGTGLTIEISIPLSPSRPAKCDVAAE
jgi:signal transduction histidine kinase